MSAPARQRPGLPEGKWWHPLALLGVMFGASAIGWALLVGVVWLVWAYTLAAVSILVALAAVVLVAHLALKRGWRPKAVAVALFAALVALVRWVASR